MSQAARIGRSSPVEVESATLDHVVVISDDLDAAVHNARTAGFTVVPGGTHGNGYTHNALIGFADGAYLELIAPTARGRGGTHRWFPRLSKGGGLVDFCLIVPDLAGHAAKLRQHGLDYAEPVAMTRATPAGDVVAWSLSIAADAAANGWPFFIEDTTPRALRVPHAPEHIQHANGAIGVADIMVLVRDVERSTMEFETLLGSRAHRVQEVPEDRAPRATIMLGKTCFTLARPGSSAEAEHFWRFGPGPYALTLRTRHGGVAQGAGTPLDPTLFSGARILLA